jgi:hypothetical protein
MCVLYAGKARFTNKSFSMALSVSPLRPRPKQRLDLLALLQSVWVKSRE